jgi:hypothetical protein
LATAPTLVRVVSVANPATYAVDAIRRALQAEVAGSVALWSGLSFGLDCVVLTLVTAVALAIATVTIERRPR